jgi:hypothetical protein
VAVDYLSVAKPSQLLEEFERDSLHALLAKFGAVIPADYAADEFNEHYFVGYRDFVAASSAELEKSLTRALWIALGMLPNLLRGRIPTHSLLRRTRFAEVLCLLNGEAAHLRPG